MRNIFLFLFAFLLHTGMTANETIIIEDGMFGIDPIKKLIVVNQNIDSINATYLQQKNAIFINNRLYTIETPVDKVQIGIKYSIIADNRDIYTLYFSQLPIIHISTANIIVDEPKVAATFKMVESSSNTIISDIGIEIRGASTQYLYSKKSYKIVFREDDTGENNRDVSLLGMRLDDDWDLQAMPNQPLRIRSKCSFDIWRKINSLHYQSSESEAINSSRWEYAELFLNGNYQGIYGVSEPVDRKQLKLKKYAEDKGIRGELYKGQGWGPNVFNSCPPYDNNSLFWGNSDGYGFECIYPKEVNPDWKNLYDFVYLVVNGSDPVFYSQYQTYFNPDNAVDYFIFLNLLRAGDNTGKNLFVAKYNTNEPYFYVPWDLDGVFGTIWNGSQDNTTNDLLTNGFYNRLLKDDSENGFKDRLKKKWKQLRTDWLTSAHLMNRFHENYDYLLQNGVYERESIAWNDYDFDPQQLDYMSDWITNRIKYLDETFNESTGIKNIQAGEIQCPCDVRIYNVKGQLLKFTHLNSLENELIFSNLSFSSGVYFIHIQNFNSHEVRKIIIR